LFQYNLAVFHLIQHDLIDLYSSKWLYSNIYLSSHCKMIAACNGRRCISAVNCLYALYEVLTFFTNRRLAFCITKVWRIKRVYASYVVSKKLVLYFKPFFLLSKLVESCCYLLSCHYCFRCCHKLCSLVGLFKPWLCLVVQLLKDWQSFRISPANLDSDH
jgi:hypothetical protein